MDCSKYFKLFAIGEFDCECYVNFCANLFDNCRTFGMSFCLLIVRNIYVNLFDRQFVCHFLCSWTLHHGGLCDAMYHVVLI